MMSFAQKARRTPPESIVPMINVVFLLLIFFLMTAQIAPPEPFEVTPPTVQEGDPATGSFTLFLGADGTLGFREHTDTQTVLSALQQERQAFCRAQLECVSPDLTLRADSGVDGRILAGILKQLGGAGFASVELVTAVK